MDNDFITATLQEAAVEPVSDIALECAPTGTVFDAEINIALSIPAIVAPHRFCVAAFEVTIDQKCRLRSGYGSFSTKLLSTISCSLHEF